MKAFPSLQALAAFERRQWHLDRAPGCRVVRFSRIAPPTVLEGGLVLPDISLEIPPEIRLDGDSKDGRDSAGRMWVQANAANWHETVTAEMFGMALRMKIAPGAFDNGGMQNFEKRPRMLWGHNTSEPIGNWPTYELTDELINAVGYISSAPGRPATAQGLMADKALDVSIGFDVDEADYNEDAERLDITRSSMREISLVGLPAMKSSFVQIAPIWAKQEAAPPQGRLSRRETPGGLDEVEGALDDLQMALAESALAQALRHVP